MSIQTLTAAACHTLVLVLPAYLGAGLAKDDKYVYNFVCSGRYISVRGVQLGRKKATTLPGTTVRIREETREALRELENHTGEGPQDLLARAVDQFRRSLILAETNVAYSRLRAESPEVLDAEIREWDAVLADGLD